MPLALGYKPACLDRDQVCRDKRPVPSLPRPRLLPRQLPSSFDLPAAVLVVMSHLITFTCSLSLVNRSIRKFLVVELKFIDLHARGNLTIPPLSGRCTEVAKRRALNMQRMDDDNTI